MTNGQTRILFLQEVFVLFFVSVRDYRVFQWTEKLITSGSLVVAQSGDW